MCVIQVCVQRPARKREQAPELGRPRAVDFDAVERSLVRLQRAAGPGSHDQTPDHGTESVGTACLLGQPLSEKPLRDQAWCTCSIIAAVPPGVRSRRAENGIRTGCRGDWVISCCTDCNFAVAMSVSILRHLDGTDMAGCTSIFDVPGRYRWNTVLHDRGRRDRAKPRGFRGGGGVRGRTDSDAVTT